MLLQIHDTRDEAKLISVKFLIISNAPGWFIGMGFSKFHDFSMTFDDFSKFHDFPWLFQKILFFQVFQTLWEPCPINSHPLGSMSIGPPIPEIQPFQNLTLKIQGQGHSSMSQSRYNNLFTHLPFVLCQSALPFVGYSYFKTWHWKFKVKVMGEVKVESHNMGPTFSWLTSLLFHVKEASHSWVTTF